MVIESELNDRNNKCHNLTLHNSKLQSQNNDLMQMLEGYEVKVNDLNKSLKNEKAKSKEFGDDFKEHRKNI